MNYRPMLVTNTILVAGMAGLSYWAWGQIPDDAKIPVHWNAFGQVDRFGSKTEALVALPIVAFFVTLLLWIIPRFDPRKSNIEASATFWNAVSIAQGLFLAYLHVLLVAIALKHEFDLVGAMLPGLSLLFAAIGNYLGKARSNWFGGVRTPWTMSSEYSWSRTHRLTGRLFVLTGLAGIAAWYMLPTQQAFTMFIASVVAASVISVIASYVFWKSDPARTTT